MAAPGSETDAYLSDLWFALAERGADEHRAERAIGHLDHGLEGTRSPLKHYGQVDQLADAVIDAFSDRYKHRSLAAFYVGSTAAYLVVGALMAFRMPANGSSTGDRVFMWMLLAFAVSMPMVQISNGLGGGYLLPASKLVSRSVFGFSRRPVSTGRFLLGLGLMLLMLSAFFVATRIMPPDYSGSLGYLVSLNTLWVILTLSLLMLVLSGGAFVRWRRVPINGEARYLLRDWGDNLQTPVGLDSHRLAVEQSVFDQ